MTPYRDGWPVRPSSLRDRCRTAIARRVGIDARALAAFRIALGVVLLIDLLLRARHLTAFYTDTGVLPRTTLIDAYPAARFSLHAAAGTAWAQAGLFVLAAGVAAALLIGYRTTLATAVSLLLLTSLHLRNPFILNGGDVLLRRLLLWGVFLPLGRRWSIDAHDDPDPPSRVATVASAALLGQVVVVYTVTGLFKLRGIRWLAGTQLHYLFHIDQLTVLIGNTLVAYPGLLRLLTWLWLGMVLSAVLLIALTGLARAVLTSLFIAMHLGMLATMQLGIFPLISIAGLLPFYPSRVWDRLDSGFANATDAIRRLRPRYPIPRPHTPLRDPRPPRLANTPTRWPSTRALPAMSGFAAGPDGARLRRRAGPVIVAGLVVGSLAWNAMGLGYVAAPDALAAIRDPADHRWDMFSRGERSDGWFVAPGRLESSDRIDAYRRAPITWDRPPDLARTYPSARWLRYSLALRGNEALLAPFAAYLCWRWNRHHDNDVRTLTVYYNKIPISLDDPSPPKRTKLLTHSC